MRELTATELRELLRAARGFGLHAARILEEVHERMGWDPSESYHPNDRTLVALLAEASQTLEALLETSDPEPQRPESETTPPPAPAPARNVIH